ncbi:hypothetical protein PR048_002635 [Dryococelus australis]|uniref:Uncharacterized protein n=1 Tax=Dryococelus australis TaxID=614101 RepID=A0ABQ9IKS5_9NEOP|nr:hypothetical protein PR048_002635 [Dryococelus australis]
MFECQASDNPNRVLSYKGVPLRILPHAAMISSGAWAIVKGQMIDDEPGEQRVATEMTSRIKICDCERRCSEECDWHAGLLSWMQKNHTTRMKPMIPEPKEKTSGVVWVALNIEVSRADEGENARAGETGDTRENPPTSGIIRHDSHMLKPQGDSAGNRTRKRYLHRKLQPLERNRQIRWDYRDREICAIRSSPGPINIIASVVHTVLNVGDGINGFPECTPEAIVSQTVVADYSPFTVTSAFSEVLLKFYFQYIPPPHAN